MGCTACTEPQCLYKGALYLYLTLQERKYNRQQQHVNRCLYQGGSPAKFLEASRHISFLLLLLLLLLLTALQPLVGFGLLTYLTNNQFSYQFPIGSTQSDNSRPIYAQFENIRNCTRGTFGAYRVCSKRC